MKSAGQKSEHVLVIPGGLLATGPHADPGGSVTAHEVDGDFALDGQIAGRRPVPDAAVVLPERDIEDPMEPIFYGPVTADRLIPTALEQFRFDAEKPAISKACGDLIGSD